jgi:putative phage-type endonuclease
VTANLALRGNKIGGSDIGVILGYSKYKTPVQLWAEKTGTLPPDQSKTIAQELGDVLEPWLAVKYEQRTGNMTVEWGQLEHPEHDFAIANLDRLVVPKMPPGTAWIDGADTILECKSRGVILPGDSDWGPDGTDQVPMDVYLQCLWYLGFRPNFKYAVISALFGKNEHRLYTIQRDRDVEEMILRKAGEWRDKYVLAGVAPEPVRDEDVKILYPQAKAKTRYVADNDTLKALDDLGAAEARLEEATHAVEACKVKIKHALGHADELVSPSGVKLARWSNCKAPQRLDIKMLQAEHPQVYNACLKDGTKYRRFTVI